MWQTFGHPILVMPLRTDTLRGCTTLSEILKEAKLKKANVLKSFLLNEEDYFIEWILKLRLQTRIAKREKREWKRINTKPVNWLVNNTNSKGFKSAWPSTPTLVSLKLLIHPKKHKHGYKHRHKYEHKYGPKCHLVHLHEMTILPLG